MLANTLCTLCEEKESVECTYNVHASLYSNFFYCFLCCSFQHASLSSYPYSLISFRFKYFFFLSHSLYISRSLSSCRLNFVICFECWHFFLFLCMCFLERTMQYVNVLTPWNKWKDALKNDVIERFVECVSKALHVCFGSLSHSQSSYKRIQLIFAGTGFFFFFQSDLTATRQNTPRRCLPN